jgi:hypothetical protein
MTAVADGTWTIDFGQVTVGSQANATILVADDGACPMSILVVQPPSDLQFTFGLSPNTAIQPAFCQSDAGATVPLSFRPFSVGAKNTTVSFENDTSVQPTITLMLSGTGVE